ncbi:hypothetical protein FCV25MIE_28671 [Fagus crenata]
MRGFTALGRRERYYCYGKVKGATALKNVRDITTLGDLGYHGFRRREGYHSLGKARGITALGDIRVSRPWEMKDITTLGNVRGITALGDVRGISRSRESEGH